MDWFDEQLIKILQEDSRRSNTEIAKTLKVSEGTIRHRINKLLENGLIKKFTVVLEKQTSAIIMVKTSPDTATEAISKNIKKLGIDFVLEIAGNFDILCAIRTKNMAEANEIVEKIRAIKGVIATETLPVLKQY